METCQSLYVLGGSVCWNIKWLDIVSSLTLGSWLCVFSLYLLEAVVHVGGSSLLCYFAICGWAGEASFGNEGLAHLAFSTATFSTATLAE